MWPKLICLGVASVIVIAVVAITFQAKAQSTSPDANEAAAVNPAVTNGWTSERTANAKPKPLPDVDPAAVRAATQPKHSVDPAGKVGGESNEFR